jgi:hypothetical protein
MVAALLLALFAASASATVFHVDAGSGDAPDQDLNDGMCDAAAGPPVTCTIRAAVQTANSLASPSADEIEIPAGPYAFSVGGNDDTAALGDLDITSNLEIRGVGGNATINAAGLDRIFHIPSGIPTVTLSNLTLNGGNAASASHGGAIKAESGALTIRNSTISGNQAADGGSRGGGIYASAGASSLMVTDSSIGGNQVAPGAVFGGFGGGIYSEVPLTMERSTVYSNVVAQGCTQIGCAGSGGGLYLAGGGTLTNVTVYDNRADGNSMGNAANAGGILAGGPTTLINSTLASNTTTGGAGGLGGGNLVAGGETILRNTIVANGSSNNPGYENCGIPDFGPYTSQGHNLEARPGQGASQCGLTPGSNGDITSTNAGLGTFGFHGGPTQTVALMPLSPAVDAGGPTGPATDQRGVSRPQGSRCDIGAFELAQGGTIPGSTCAGPPSPPVSTPLIPATTAAPPPTRKKCKKGRKLKKGKCVRKKKRR